MILLSVYRYWDNGVAKQPRARSLLAWPYSFKITDQFLLIMFLDAGLLKMYGMNIQMLYQVKYIFVLHDIYSYDFFLGQNDIVVFFLNWSLDNVKFSLFHFIQNRLCLTVLYFCSCTSCETKTQQTRQIDVLTVFVSSIEMRI